MARKLRLEFSGACYHVTNRGNYRRDLFATAGAAESFIGCLDEAALRFNWQAHAFGVMSNHFHLALETPEPNLSDGMQWLQSTWASRFNRFRNETGRPFQGRYKAAHVQPGHDLAQVAHYIHLNPVRAGIVTAEQVLAYRWTSLPRFARPDRPRWLQASTILRESGGLADTPAGWKGYVLYLALLAGGGPLGQSANFERLRREWSIGSMEFKARLAGELADQDRTADRIELLGADREQHRRLRAEIWEEKLRRGAAALGITLETLPAMKSAPEKVMLAALLKSVSSVSNGWLTGRLHMGKASSVSQYIGRFSRSGGTEIPEFKVAQSKVEA